MRIHSKSLTSVLVAVVAAIALAACGSSGTTVDQLVERLRRQLSSGGTLAIAAPAKTNDYGWNAQGLAGAKAAASTDGLKVKLVQNIGYNNTDTVLRQLALAKPKLIIAHASGFDTSAQRIALQYKVPTITYDIPTLLQKGSLSNITTSSQQGAYLAGILAAEMTKTNKIGVIISASDTNWYEMTGGYAAGAHSVKPHLSIVFGQIGPASYDDSAGGKRIATSVIASGADVIFTMGDDASFGYLQAIGTAHPGHKLWMIGDIGDMSPDRYGPRVPLVGPVELHPRL